MIADLDLKYYMFDWDDNVLHMPTRIHLEQRVNGEWQPCGVSTSEFAHIRNDSEGYRPPGGDWSRAFSEFNDDGERGERAFIEDTRMALDAITSGASRAAPSFEAFRQALIHGHLFAIITARAHQSATIRKAVEYFVERMLSREERSLMVQHLQAFMQHFDGEVQDLPEAEILRRYLDLNHYHGVSSAEFKERSGLQGEGAESPEVAKQYAIRDFIRHIFSLLKDKAPEQAFSIGFSDDDPRNIEAVEQYIRNQLAATFPHVKFVMYDTSDPDRQNGRKIVFTEKNEAEGATPCSLKRFRVKEVFWGLTLLVGIWIVYQSPLREELTHVRAMQARLEATGALAETFFVLGSIAITAIGFPRMLIYPIGGLAFGFGWGLCWSLLALLFGGYLPFCYARWGGRAWITRRWPRMERVADYFKARSYRTVVLLRVLPMPGFLTNAFLGITRIKHRSFLLGTLLGSIPPGIPATLLGSGMVEEDPERQAIYTAISIVLFGLLWVVLPFALRKHPNIQLLKEAI